jgi:hypothetical protein
VCYAVVVALVRLGGKRTLANVDEFDLVITIAIGSLVGTAMLSREVALADVVVGMAPPSELACGWSKAAMIGFEIPWTRSALCAIQAVAIEPPQRRAMSRLVNALFAYLSGSMALFFDPSVE